MRRDLALKSFKSFLSLIGNDRICEPPQFRLAEFLQEFYDAEDVKIAVVMAPRGSLKTTLSSILYPLWIAMKNPNARFLLDSNVIEQSAERLTSIRQLIDNKDLLNLINPGMVNQEFEDNKLAFRIGTSTAIDAKEPTFKIGGINKEKTGGHCDYIVMDDVVTDQNYMPEPTKNSVIPHFKFMMPLLDDREDETGGKIIVVGTPYGASDGYAWLFKTLEDGGIKFMRYSESAYTPVSVDIASYKTEADFVAAGCVLNYPRILSFDKLKLNRAVMGSADFFSQFLMVLMPGEDAKFDVTKVMKINRNALPVSMRRYILTDEAGDPTQQNSPTKKDGDKTAILVVGVDSLGRVYLLDGVCARMSETEAIEFHLLYRKMYGVMLLAIEKTGLSNLGQHTRIALRREGVFAQVEDMKPATKSKFSRISDLDIIVNLGLLRVVTDCPVGDRLLYELSMVRIDGTLPENDDVIDALAWITTLLAKYGLPQADGAEAARDMEIKSCGDDRSLAAWKSNDRLYAARKIVGVPGVGEFSLS